MGEIFSALERLFGPRLLVAALLLVLVYLAIASLLKLITAINDRSSLASRVATLKAHYEIVKLSKEIEALKKNNQLPDDPREGKLAEHAAYLTEALSHTDSLGAARQAVENELTKFAVWWRPFGLALYLASQLGLRLWGTALLTYTAIGAFVGGDRVTSGAQWDNIIMMDAMIVVGFLISNVAISATRRAHISDPIGYWSYVAGFAISTVLVWLESTGNYY